MAQNLSLLNHKVRGKSTDFTEISINDAQFFGGVAVGVLMRFKE